jgi:hypothetical protein
VDTWTLRLWTTASAFDPVQQTWHHMSPGERPFP